MFSINEIHLFWNGFRGNLTESFQLFQNLTPLEKGTSFLELVVVYCKGKVFRFFPETGNCFLQEKRAGFSYVYGKGENGTCPEKKQTPSGKSR
jgi:hypothetical protein